MGWDEIVDFRRDLDKLKAQIRGEDVVVQTVQVLGFDKDGFEAALEKNAGSIEKLFKEVEAIKSRQEQELLSLRTQVEEATSRVNGQDSSFTPFNETDEYKTFQNTFRTIEERIQNMALNLDALAQEVARVQNVQSSAMLMLKKLTLELEDISAQLKAKSTEVANAVDETELNRLIEELKTSTGALAEAVADSTDVLETRKVVLNADDPSKPTVAVVMPEVMPTDVIAKVDTVVDTVDAASPEEQIVVTVVPATEAEPIEGKAVVDTIVTEEGLTDINVYVPEAEHAEVKEASGVDVVEAVVEAFDKEPEVVAAPEEPEVVEEVSVILNADDPTKPTVEVKMPEVMPEVVTAEAEKVADAIDTASPEPQVVITIEEAPAEVIADATAVKDTVETNWNEVDVTVAVPADEVAAAAADASVNVVEEAKAAVTEAHAEGEVVAEADKADEVSVVLHADDPTKPTVEIKMPDILPEVVTTTVESAADVVDPASTEPQVVIKVEDAAAVPVVEGPVVSDVAKTEEGQVDVEVEAPIAVQEATLEEKSVDIVAEVIEAIETTTDPQIEAVPEAPSESTEPGVPTA